MKQDIKDKGLNEVKDDAGSKLKERNKETKVFFEEERSHLPAEEKKQASEAKKLKVHEHLRFSDKAESDKTEDPPEKTEKKSRQHGIKYQARFKQPDKSDVSQASFENEIQTYNTHTQDNEDISHSFSGIYDQNENIYPEPEKTEKTQNGDNASVEDIKDHSVGASKKSRKAVKRELKRNKSLKVRSNGFSMQTRDRLRFDDSVKKRAVSVNKRKLSEKARYRAQFEADKKYSYLKTDEKEYINDDISFLNNDSGYFDYTDALKAEPDTVISRRYIHRQEAADIEVKKENHGRLRYSKNEIPPAERLKEKDNDPENFVLSREGLRQQRNLKKAQRRVILTESKLKKAQEKLPEKRRVRLSKQYDDASGKIKHRLQFEDNAVVENEKPAVSKRAAKAAASKAVSLSAEKLHEKIHETEKDNLGVEASHKFELATEKAGRRFYEKSKKRIRDQPYKRLEKAEKRSAKANSDLVYRQLLYDDSKNKKRESVKRFQRQRIKRRYAAAARETAKDIQHSRNIFNSVSQTVRKAAQFVSARKTALGIIAAGVLIIALMSSLFASCTTMLTGVQSAITATCYMASDRDINESELRYTELETDLQKNIDDTEVNFPGYDEYRYSIDNIGHDPYELMGYLSAAFGNFTYEEIQPELLRLFGLQYTLKREKINETRDGKSWHVLKTTLTVRPLSEIISGELSTEEFEHYKVYMQTYGNRQCFGNPFDFSWLNYVTSPYGYRIHPISKVKKLHRGIDIGVPQGTPIKAVQDGSVVSAGDSGGYGLCVVISGEDGYTSKYAHCSSLAVSSGQTVKRGDVIAYVGSTGNSTGPHLHLEVAHNGEDLNPYYFVDNGGSGSEISGGAQIPDYSGEPVGDGTFAAMLKEAEKYLGYPYVWGGSSPSTSFDCSGFVSWVINHSGAGNVGRSTAQGLYNICTPVSRENAKPGDLIFFTKTYSTSKTITHVGIYVGGGKMIHCGNPISYANINSNYWTKHFYSFGRLP